MSKIILIHGAYQGGWIWNVVAPILRDDGHVVFTPTLDGCGERSTQLRAGITTETQADEIVEMLRLYDLDEVVLAATSAGGMVMARVAELARKRISRLVFVDALALLDGEKIRDIVTKPADINTDVGIGQSREDIEGRLLSDLEPELRTWAAERFTLHPQACFNDPVVLSSFWQDTWDASVIWCSGAMNPGEAHNRRAAELLNADWHVIETGHYPMLTTPVEVARIIAGNQ